MTTYLFLEQRCDHDAIEPHPFQTSSEDVRRCPGGIITRFAAEQELEFREASGASFFCQVKDVIAALRFKETPTADIKATGYRSFEPEDSTR